MRHLLLVVMLAIASPVHAGAIYRAAVGVGGISFDATDPKPNDFEFGGNVVASVQPHISGVGDLYYGVDHSYLRGSVGARFTLSNPEDPNFGVGVGASYNVSSEPALRPEGLSYDTALGYIPWPDDAPRLNLAVKASWFPRANQAGLVFGIRYVLGGN